MRESSVCWLISETYAPDDILQQVPTRTCRMVYCNIGSITLSEWSEASQNGLNPEMVVDVFAGDYAGEEYVNVGGTETDGVLTGGTVFAIYRAYHGRGDRVDLYLERRQGAQ